LAQLDGVYWTIASLLYGSGLRPMECLRLRVKDLDFDAHQITVRDGKGAKDRVTVLARQSMQPLRSHLQRKLEHHRRDLLRGSGETYLPVALARKCPRAAREWPWQFVFPARSDVFWRWLERGIKRP
jgi:integrase